jgi:hypothetical protein
MATQPKKSSDSMLKDALSGNNKIMLVITITLCAGLLILLGVGADDIIKLLVGK